MRVMADSESGRGFPTSKSTNVNIHLQGESCVSVT
jgi:hypothetical protein